MTLIDRLWLGTVQIGLRYGLAARAPEKAEAFALLDRAWEMGFRRFDTARAYGESEERIGRWMAARGHYPTIASKLPSLGSLADSDTAAAVEASIERSRAALGRERIEHYLCHRAEDFARPAVRESLLRAEADGRIGLLGVSCYAPQEAVTASNGLGRIGLVQLPVNVLDTRAIFSPARTVLRERGGRLVARSLFLQGVLLLPPNRLPAHLSDFAPAVRRLAEVAANFGVPRPQLALAFVLDRIPDADAVLGFQNATELEALQDIPEHTGPIRPALDALEGLSESVPASLLDPRTWPQIKG